MTHSLMDVLPVTGLKPSRVYVALLCGASFTPCAPAPLLYRGVGLGHTAPHLSRLSAVEQLPDDVFLHLLFSPQHPCNTVGLLSAHMHFVAGVCQAQRSLLEGLESVILYGKSARSV